MSEAEASRAPRRWRAPVAVATRLTAALIAVGLAGWFVLQAENSRRLGQAQALLSGPRPPSGAEAGRAARLLGDVTLYPGYEADLLRARLAIEEGRRTQASQILSGVLRAEPKNLEAWLLLAEDDPSRRLLDVAVTHIGQLDPLR